MKQSISYFPEGEWAGPTGNALAWNMVASLPPRAADEDLRVARSNRANVLLVGHDPHVSDAAAYLAGSATSATVTMWTADGPRFPPHVTPEIVVIARHVEQLGSKEQLELLYWLTMASEETRVISTASPALWPMVCEGAFNPQLYYRLNTVCIRLA